MAQIGCGVAQIRVRRGSDRVRRGSVRVRRGSDRVRRGFDRVRRGPDNSGSACCTAGLEGRYYNPIPTRFLETVDCFKIPALDLHQ